MPDMTFSAAQADMRNAYAGGVIGILVSGSAWLVAGAVATYRTPQAAILALLIGGMLIHPLSVLLARLAGRSGVHVKDNPSGQLAMEGTVWMLLAIVLAYGLSL